MLRQLWKRATPLSVSRSTSLNKWVDRIEARWVSQMSLPDAFETIEFTKQGGVGLLTLNRPDSLNAVSSLMTREIFTVLRGVDGDPKIMATVLTGKGSVFCAGADLKEIQAWVESGDKEQSGLGEWKRFGEIQKPVIGAVNGAALGGGSEIAMMCDVVVASENAYFGQPEVQVGLIPGMGATQRLIRAVGKSKAMEMILTGEKRGMKAEEALQRGLVSKVVKTGDVVSEAMKIADRISQLSVPVVIKAKQCVKAAEPDLTEGLRLEYEMFLSCFDVEDSKEGMRAFFEKRKPVWKHE
ncbi:hypothetical protein BSKO_01522 [Bryopsis sp. KO-2023]|nr:hypothetical protein BSKO_01522 [Bryopsis sp. KO-2023]